MSNRPEFSNIIKAIRAAENPSAVDYRSALDFLDHPPRECAHVARAYVEGLKSSSQEVRELCALNIGKFGRRSDWAVPALVEAFDRAMPESMEAAAVAFSLAALKTKAAAAGLATFVEHKFATGRDNDYRVVDALKALSGMGPLAAPYLPLYHQAFERLRGDSSHLQEEVRLARTALSKSIRNEYQRYTNTSEAGTDRLFQIDLTKDEIELDIARELGTSTLLFDQRVLFNNPTQEVRCIVLQLPNNSLACIGVLDTFTGEQLQANFGVFIQQVRRALQATINPNHPLLFFLSIMPDRSSDGSHQLKQALLEKEENRNLSHSWRSALESIQAFDSSLSDVEGYLLTPLSPPLSFMQYYEGALQDKLSTEFLLRYGAQAEEHSVDYTSMESDFSREIRDILQQPAQSPSRSKATKQPLPSRYQDSLAGTSIQELPLPKSLQDFFAEAAAYHERREELRQYYQGLLSDPANNPEEIHSELFVVGDIGMGEAPPFPSELLTRQKENWALDASSLSIYTSVAIDPLQEGIVLAASLDSSFKVFSNVPLTVVTCSHSYSWNKHDLELMLALNVLNLFIPPESDGRPSIRQETFGAPPKHTACSQTTVDLVQDFADELLFKVPEYGGFISAERIKNWIRSKVRERTFRKD